MHGAIGEDLSMVLGSDSELIHQICQNMSCTMSVVSACTYFESLKVKAETWLEGSFRGYKFISAAVDLFDFLLGPKG